MAPGLQAERLAALGASPEETAELLAYNENVFDLGALGPETRFPLPDEPFVAFWEERVRESQARGKGGAFAVLREHLPQLAFPIREGISETEPYRAATRRGIPVETLPEATGLELEHPEAIELAIHESPAGRIPLLIARRRPEFAALIQALTKRNEPVPVPGSQGALMVSGYNNWSRIGELRRAWEAGEPSTHETAMTATGPRNSSASRAGASCTRTASSSSRTAPTAPCPRPTWASRRRNGASSPSPSGATTSAPTTSPAGSSAPCATMPWTS